MSISRSAFFQAVAAVQASGVVTVQSPLPSSDDTDGNSSDSLSRTQLPLPLVLVASQPSTTSMQVTTEWIAANQTHLESLLWMTGALFFRGFPTPLAVDFGLFVESFAGWKDLPYEESLSYAVRLPITNRVCTTNEGKRGGLIFHHELAQAPSPNYPSKLLFFCENPADEGGDTAVTPSWRVLDELKANYPEFVQQCKSKGVVYHTVFPAEADHSKGVGRSWKSFWGDDNKERVAARMSKLGYTGRWDEQDRLHLDTPVLPATRTLADGTEVFFNQMIAQVRADTAHDEQTTHHHLFYSPLTHICATPPLSFQYLANAREFSDQAGLHGGAAKLDEFIKYGDGSPVEAAALEFAYQVSEKHASNMSWQKGDIACIDNYLCMHARREFEGPRKVYASLVQ